MRAVASGEGAQGRTIGEVGIALRMQPSIPEPDSASTSMEELIRACIDTGDTASWESFVRQTHGVIAATVFRTARRYGQSSPALIADLVQEAYLRICENRCRVLREFRPSHADAIFGLLKSIAFSVTQDHFRAGFAQKRGAGRPETSLDRPAESQLASGDEQAAMERRILLNEVDEFLAGGKNEKRIFWLYYRHGLTARAIAAIPGIGLTQKGVESTIHRLTERVRDWLAKKKPIEKGKDAGPAL